MHSTLKSKKNVFEYFYFIINRIKKKFNQTSVTGNFSINIISRHSMAFYLIDFVLNNSFYTPNNFRTVKNVKQ